MMIKRTLVTIATLLMVLGLVLVNPSHAGLFDSITEKLNNLEEKVKGEEDTEESKALALEQEKVLGKHKWDSPSQTSPKGRM